MCVCMCVFASLLIYNNFINEKRLFYHNKIILIFIQ